MNIKVIMNIKVYAVIDNGDGDIFKVYLSKREAQASADGLAPCYRCSVQETQIEVSLKILLRLLFSRSSQ
jgi:hypothetical protein